MKNTQNDQEQTRSFEHDLAGKYLTVSLAGEEYGVPIRPIEDIIEIQDITEVPQTDEFVEGVINLRGSVIPVVDLRKKFNVEVSPFDRKTCIVVVTLQDVQTGLIVDRVREVTEFGDSQIDPAPKMSQRIQTRFIAGMGKLDEEVIILLDLEKVMAGDEVEQLEQVNEESIE